MPPDLFVFCANELMRKLIEFAGAGVSFHIPGKCDLVVGGDEVKLASEPHVETVRGEWEKENAEEVHEHLEDASEVEHRLEELVRPIVVDGAFVVEFDTEGEHGR